MGWEHCSMVVIVTRVSYVHWNTLDDNKAVLIKPEQPLHKLKNCPFRKSLSILLKKFLRSAKQKTRKNH